jgi:hypothetical protein
MSKFEMIRNLKGLVNTRHSQLYSTVELIGRRVMIHKLTKRVSKNHVS